MGMREGRQQSQQDGGTTPATSVARSRPFARRLIAGLTLTAASLVGAASGAMAGDVPEALFHKAAGNGSVRVIVQLRLTTRPEGDLAGAHAVGSQRQRIASMQSALLAGLAGTSHRAIREFATIPFMALDVGSDALSALKASPNVVAVEEDRLDSPSLSQSVPLVGADQAWAAGFDGAGIMVAILDTGVDKTHPFLSGKVVEEACYSANGNCPNGLTSQTGPGAGVPCAYAANGCRHGTHVAGIAAGSGAGAGIGFSGVAKGAQVLAVQVFSRFTGSDCTGSEDPCALTYASDQIAGLERVFAMRAQYTIAAVNMSLGSGHFTSPCDSSEAARKAAIDNLRSVGIATVISSGNSGFTDGLGTPACISTAISMGSTTKSDVVSSFSNSASFLSLLAPGSDINSSVPGGGFAVFNGTSMAAPHATGAWAILKQKKPTATVTELLAALQTTGLPITDSRNGVTTPRIRIFHALQSIGGPPPPQAEQLHVFVRGVDDHPYQIFSPSPGAAWQGWFGLPGDINQAPAPASYNGQLHLFVRGFDDALYQKIWNGSQWSDWIGFPGLLASGPAVVSHNGQLHVFAVGVDSALYQMFWDGSQWNGWIRIPAVVYGSPTAVSYNGQLHVFVTGGDNALYQTIWDGSQWNGWYGFGGFLTTGPAAAGYTNGGVNHLHVFAVGGDSALYQMFWDGSQWNGWIRIPAVVTAKPAATDFANRTQLHVFVRGGDNALYQKIWNGSQWSDWIGFVGVLESGPGATSYHSP